MKKLYLRDFSEYLKPRPRDFHKGLAGHILIIGGTLGFSGAVLLAAEAALRVGAGLVTIATHQEHAAWLNLSRPELMCHGLHSGEALLPFLSTADIVIIGPGLGQTAWSHQLLMTVLTHPIVGVKKTLIVDADALNLMAAETTPIKKSNWILTPHPGEAGRLLRWTTQKIQENRLVAIQQLQQIWGGVCVLKGRGSLILGSGESDPALCEAGNPGMATAGMGDVLSGVIGGLAGQGISIEIAAQLGVLVHALAGDAAACQGERGMIASDVVAQLRYVVNNV